MTVSDAAGKEVKRATTASSTPTPTPRTLINFDEAPAGDYTAITRLPGQGRQGRWPAGTAPSAKEDLAKKYEWWNTKRGSIEKVIAPWTPVTLKGKTLGVWGREMSLGAAGLPARSPPRARKILAAPGRLVATLADGKEDRRRNGVKTKTRFDQDHRKIVEVESAAGRHRVSQRGARSSSTACTR